MNMEMDPCARVRRHCACGLCLSTGASREMFGRMRWPGCAGERLINDSSRTLIHILVYNSSPNARAFSAIMSTSSLVRTYNVHVLKGHFIYIY